MYRNWRGIKELVLIKENLTKNVQFPVILRCVKVYRLQGKQIMVPEIVLFVFFIGLLIKYAQRPENFPPGMMDSFQHSIFISYNLQIK